MIARARRLLATGTIAASLALLAVGPVLADYRHVFSSGVEDSEGRGYSGLKFERNVLDNVDLASCWPAYQTDWVYTDYATFDWFEVVTAHRCEGVWTILGAGRNGQWIETAYWTSGYGTSYGQHVFNIRQDQSDGFWEFLIDGNRLPYRLYSDGTRAERLVVVLESYDDDTVVPGHHPHDLQYRRWSNPYRPWEGRDGTQNNAPGTVCRRWNSDTSIELAENASCD